jgi:hypothetical protein
MLITNLYIAINIVYSIQDLYSTIMLSLLALKGITLVPPYLTYSIYPPY